MKNPPKWRVFCATSKNGAFCPEITPENGALCLENGGENGALFLEMMDMWG